MSQEFPELGCYGLAGHSASPRDLLSEVATAERIGLGSVFLSERFNTKEAFTLVGAAAAVSDRIGIATAVTNHTTRHPMLAATAAVTAHRLSEGRFALGLGRGVDMLFDVMGLPRITFAQMRDAIDLYRRLWRGEVVLNHDGPAGRFPLLSLDPSFDEDIPIVLAAIGDRTLDFAGQVADGVVLHSFFTDETLARAVATIRGAAERAGRDPASVRIWSVLVTVPDGLDEQTRQRRLIGRLATYLQGYGDLLVRTNGWDPEALARFRADPLVAGYRGAFDAIGTVDELDRVSALLPPQWWGASATGSPAHCAQRVADQFGAGADGVILHGSTPSDLEPVVGAWREIRPPSAFSGLPANPGRTVR